jgi:crotonobetainyl-CoA:carnitine CoA-transferase CaiB-like acyl-CoA transferase
VGDPGRRLSPVAPGVSAFFEPLNRGKRGIVLDLQAKEGREVFLRLAEGADVLVHNLSVGVMERLGLGYDEVAAVNPGIIYAHGTGLGHRGPDAELGVVDLIGQARGGLASVTDTEQPTPAGAIISDHLGGMYLLAGILAAVAHRERTGEGQFVESSMLGALIATQSWEISTHLATGNLPQAGRGHQLLAGIYGIYETAAGYLAITGIPDATWDEFCRLTGGDELSSDARFATPAGRRENVAALKIAVQKALLSVEAKAIAKKLQALGVRCSPVQSYADIAEDEQALANGYIVEVQHPVLGQVRATGNPIHLGRTPTEVPDAAPRLGEHTADVLAELGMTHEDIAALQASGAIQDGGRDG